MCDFLFPKWWSLGRNFGDVELWMGDATSGQVGRSPVDSRLGYFFPTFFFGVVVVVVVAAAARFQDCFKIRVP